MRRELAWHLDCLQKELTSFRSSMADQISICLRGKKSASGNAPPSAIASNVETAKIDNAGTSGSAVNMAGTSGSASAMAGTSGSASNIADMNGSNSPKQAGSLRSDSAAPVKPLGRNATVAQIARSNLASGRDRWGRKNELPDLAMYKRNYSNFNEPVFNQHVANFEKMLELCQKNDVHLVVVNMPLTKQNRALLAKPIYDRYYSTVSCLTQAHNTPFIDMDRADTFALSDFYDSTHLNDDGGKKFFELLSDKLTQQHSQVASSSPMRTY
jgi:hypothetical protein